MQQTAAKADIPMEHERRFFPNLMTFNFKPGVHPVTIITQAYLEDSQKTRIREELKLPSSRIYLQTRKTGSGVSRTEDEYEIPKRAYEAMLTIAKCKLIKRRYFVQCDGYVAEVNIFEGDLEGYIQIEVEFATKEEAVAFVPPDWFGIEVTDDNRHGNYSLAKNGCKELLK